MSNTSEIWLPIQYGEFHDIPRVFLVSNNSETYLFDCSFSNAIDDYPDEFVVYKLPQNGSSDRSAVPWAELLAQGKRVGTIRIENMVFDDSKRKSIRGDVFGSLKVG